ncbi:MAG: PH domain-containing protein [Thermoanaerobaculia bacterium]
MRGATAGLRQLQQTSPDSLWKLPPPVEQPIWSSSRETFIACLLAGASVLVLIAVLAGRLVPQPANLIAAGAALAGALTAALIAWRASRTTLGITDMRAYRARGDRLREMPLDELVGITVTRSRWQVALRLADVTIRARGDSLRFRSIEDATDVLRALDFLERSRGRMLFLQNRSNRTDVYVSQSVGSAMPRKPLLRALVPQDRRRFEGLLMVAPPLAIVLAGSMLLALALLWPRAEAASLETEPARGGAVIAAPPHDESVQTAKGRAGASRRTVERSFDDPR